MRLLHPPVPLNAPRQEGEVVYTTLQLSRLRRTAVNFQRVVLLSLAFFLASSTLFVVIVLNDSANRSHRQCVSTNRSRAEIKQAFSALYDGFIAATGSQAARDFKTQQLANLERGLPQRDC